MSDKGLTPWEVARQDRERIRLKNNMKPKVPRVGDQVEVDILKDPNRDGIFLDRELFGRFRDDPEEVPHIPDGRPSWDEYGLLMAEAAASRADCTRRKVGAALMAADHSIISVGYNGGPSKGPSCMQGECPRGTLSKEELPGNSAYDTGGGTCVALHAEWNVLLRTDWHKFAGSTLYVTHEPCHICRVLISGTAIYRVVAPNFEWHPHGSEEIR